MNVKKKVYLFNVFNTGFILIYNIRLFAWNDCIILIFHIKKTCTINLHLNSSNNTSNKNNTWKLTKHPPATLGSCTTSTTCTLLPSSFLRPFPFCANAACRSSSESRNLAHAIRSAFLSPESHCTSSRLSVPWLGAVKNSLEIFKVVYLLYADTENIIVLRTFRVCNTLQSRALLFFFFFQLCLYLTMWLAEHRHFSPNAPKSHL